MALPSVPMPTGVVQVGGAEVHVRGLSRGEAAKLQALSASGAAVADLEIAMLAFGTDTPEDEVRAWYASVPQAVVDPIVEEINRLSGFGDARFQG